MRGRFAARARVSLLDVNFCKVGNVLPLRERKMRLPGIMDVK